MKSKTFANLALDGLGLRMISEPFSPLVVDLASPSSEEPVTQIEADVPIEPLALQADAANLDLDLQVYERPLAVIPFGYS